MKRKPSQNSIQAQLAFLAENAERDVNVPFDDDEQIRQNRRNSRAWRSPAMERSLSRPSSQWPAPVDGQVKWKRKEST
jgi:hypothetical protein